MTEILAAPWTLQSDVWDTLTLGGKEWPGIASIVVTRANKWDEKKAKGTNQAERVYQGTDPASVKITLRFWNDAEQYQTLLSECLPIVEPEDEKKRKEPLDISHAVTQARKIGRVTIDSVSGPDDNGDQTWSFSIDATEYRAPTVVKGPTGKGGGGGTRKPNTDACAGWRIDHAYLLGEIRRIEGELAVARAGRAVAEQVQAWDGGSSYAKTNAYVQDLERKLLENTSNRDAVVQAMEANGCDVSPSGGGASEP